MPRSGGLLSRCEGCWAEVHAKPGGEPPEPMRHKGGVDPCPFVLRRKCEWCGGPMKEDARANAVTCGDKCRAAKWKHERNYGRTEPGPRSGARARSGRQISFKKAVEQMAWFLEGAFDYPADEAQRFAEEAMRPALPARQQARR